MDEATLAKIKAALQKAGGMAPADATANPTAPESGIVDMLKQKMAQFNELDTRPGRQLAASMPEGTTLKQGVVPAYIGGPKTTAAIGTSFKNIVAKEEDAVHNLLANWNDSELSPNKRDIVGYLSKDRHFTSGAEGAGKVKNSQREFLDWLHSDGPFDPAKYGPNIRNDVEWASAVDRARKASGWTP